VLLRLVYLSVTNAFALLRLSTVSDRDKEIEILALRHQITVLQRRLGTTRPRFSPGDRAFLAALLHQLPRHLLGRILCRAKTGFMGPDVPFSCSLGCSAVLVDRASEDLLALDPGREIDSAGRPSRRFLLQALMRTVAVVATRGRTW
jgi:hypothetical protein